MPVLSTSYDVETLPKSVMLVEDISSAATSCKISYVPLAMTAGVLILDEGQDNEERISWNGAPTDNGDGTATLSNLGRGLPYSTNAFTESNSRQYSHTGGACTVRLVVGHELLNLKANTDRANTFSALQTFTAGIYASGSGSYVRLPNMTTAQRTALSAANGMMVYDTDLGQIYKYEGGAWAAQATGTFSNAADHTAGKVDIASVSEAAAGTATDATSGAINVIPVSLLKQDSTGAAQGNVPALNGFALLDKTLLGSGTADSTKYLRGDNTWQTLSSALVYPDKTVYASGASSTTLTNPTAGSPYTLFDTHTFAIDGSTHVLNANTGYEFEAVIDYVYGASTTSTVALRLGSTVMAVCGLNLNGSTSIVVRGWIMGTAAQGASVAVRACISAIALGSGTVRSGAGYGSQNVATNGSLTMQWAFQFDTSNGSNAATMTMCHIRKFSTTAS